MKSIFYILLSIIFLGTFTPNAALAAGFDLVNITTSPKTPGVNEEVKVRIESYAVNLNTANLVWYVNKEPVKEGIAEKEITVRTGNFGTKTTIDIIIITIDGVKINKQLVIAPAEVDVLWEAQTYTPPFYKGKALPGYKSLVRLTAIPRFNAPSSNPKEFYYKWTYNRIQNVGEALGKNSVTIPMGYTDSPVPVVVDVSLPGTDWKGEESLEISGSEAKIVFYHQAPLLGVEFEHAISSAIITPETEFNIYAVPYYFSFDNLMNNDLIYTWEVNRSYRAVDLDQRNLTLLKPEKPEGPYEVTLRIQNPKRILQEGRAQTVVSFTPEQ